MTYSRYAPYGRVYYSAKHFPAGSIEQRLATQMAAQVNHGAACALLHKYPGSTAFTDIRDWDGDASYRTVTPERSGSGSDTRFSVTGQARASPESYGVLKPSQAEVEAIYDNKLVGRFAGGEMFKIPEAETTGGIPVVDTQDPKEFFYYVPAFLERLANNEFFFEKTPTFISLKKGEMPSFVFWQRGSNWPRFVPPSSNPVADAQVPVPRTSTPRAASKSPVGKAASQDNRGVRSRAPSPQERHLTIAVDTEAAAQVSEKAAEPQWEIFDPRLEEDPVEFLDFYNTRLNGWHGNRSRMMLREADIERVNYISPCLAHNHKEVAKDTTTETATASATDTTAKVTPSPAREVVPDTAMNIDSATHPVLKTPEAAPSKSWVQPKPIDREDPHWKRFKQKQEERRTVRQSRIRPRPVFTSEYCHMPGTKKGNWKKAYLTRETYDDYYRRACKAQRLNEGLSKCCLACGLKWTCCTESRQNHYDRHRDEMVMWYKNVKGQNKHVEPAMRAESLDPSKVTFTRHVPDLNWFRDLEQVILNNENDLLQREHVCRVCDEPLDPADNNIAIHYYGHACERQGLRRYQNMSLEKQLSPVVVTTLDGSFPVTTQNISPPARPVGRLPLNSPFMVRHDEITKKRMADKMAKNLMAASKEMQTTGTITSSVEPLATLQTKEVETEPQQVETKSQKLPSLMDYIMDGPIHSDKIGESTTAYAMAPWQKSPTKSPVKASKDIGFIYEDSDAPVGQEVIQISSDSESEELPMVSPFQIQSNARFEIFSLTDAYRQVETHCRTLNFTSDAVVDTKELLKAAKESKTFQRYATEVVVAGVLLACTRGGDSQSLQKICEITGVTVREAGQMYTLLDLHVEKLRRTGDSRVARGIIKPIDDDSDLYFVPPQDDADWDIDDVPAGPSTTKAETMPTDPIFWSDSEYEYPEAVVTAIRHKSGELAELGDSADAVDEADEVEDAPTGDEDEQVDLDEEMSDATDKPKDKLNINEIVNEVLTEGPTLPAVLIAQVSELVPLLVEQYYETPGVIDTGDLSVKDWMKSVVVNFIEGQILNLPSSVTSTSPDGAHSQQAASAAASIPAPAEFKKASPNNSRSSKNAPSQQSASVAVSAPAAAQAPEATTEKEDSEEYLSDALYWTDSLVPVMEDGLDLCSGDLGVMDMLEEALDWGCGEYPLLLLHRYGDKMCVDMVEEFRASGKTPTPLVRQAITEKIQAFVKKGIEDEKRLLPEAHRKHLERRAEHRDRSDPVTTQQSDSGPTSFEIPRIDIVTRGDPHSQPIVPVMNDGLDFNYYDLEINNLLDEAVISGIGRMLLINISREAPKLCEFLVTRYRAGDGPKISAVRAHIKKKVQAFVKKEITKEKRWVREQEKTIESGQSRWSTEGLTSKSPANTSAAPRTSDSAPRVERTSGAADACTDSGDEQALKRKRPFPVLPATPISNRKRKGSRISDPSFRPGPPTPFDPDEVSPRLPKMPRKTTDPLYRPGSALLDPTTPPATPKVTKKAVKSVAKKNKGVEVEPRVFVSSNKVGRAKKTASPKDVGNKKTLPKAAAVGSGGRPKRKAAVEAEKSFGKTKIVE